MGQNVYDYDWFDLEPRLQKYMILIMLRSQDPPNFSGLYVFPCTVEVFGKVCIFLSIHTRIVK